MYANTDSCIFVCLQFTDASMRIVLPFFVLVIVLARGQVVVHLPDTTLERGLRHYLFCTLDLGLQVNDTIEVRFAFNTTALEPIGVEGGVGLKSVVIVETRASDQGQLIAHVRGIAAEALQRVQFFLIVTAKWSGASPTYLTVTEVHLNQEPIPFDANGGRITFTPSDTLHLEPRIQLGPLAPQPCSDILTVTYWLAIDGTPDFALFDNVGRLYQSWQLSSRGVGVYTVELPLDLSKVTSGLYYLRYRVGSISIVAPCVIAK